MTTKSQAGSAFRRKDSRAIRFSLFLSTARFAALREIARPSRATTASLGLARIVKKRSDDRTGSAKTRPKSFEVRRRRCGEKPEPESTNGERPPSDRRQARAALRTPALQHLTARPRRHPGAEPVRALAAQRARMKGSLHDGSVPRDAGRNTKPNKGIETSERTRDFTCGAGGCQYRGGPDALWITGDGRIRLAVPRAAPALPSLAFQQEAQSWQINRRRSRLCGNSASERWNPLYRISSSIHGSGRCNP